jgi:two-component system sensor histidine kinase KdpD
MWQNVVRWVAATLGVVLVTFLLSVAHIKETAAGLIFLAMVVWFAARAGIVLSLYVAGLCALSFDYFFLAPLHTLRLAGPQEWVEMLSFAVSSVVVGRLAERARRQTMQAEERREDVERLYTLSQDMMLHEDAAGLIHDLPRLIERNFNLDAVILYVHDQDQFYSSLTEIPESAKASLQVLVQGHHSTLTGLEKFSSLALTLGVTPIGALGWSPDRLSREAATAIGAQVAIALTRSLAIEKYTRMEAAREGERLRTALIDSLTHELRTPLTGIRAAATMLVQSEGLDEAARQDLAAVVDEESARLDKLIGEAVEMAEIDANVVQVHASPQHTRTLLEHALEESHEVLASHRVVLAVEEPDKPIWFDPHLLGRVCRHLLENAARYSPAGSRIVLGSRQRDGHVEFSVEDNGPGIDAADLPFIFEKFYRGRNSSARGKGTGMGLPIARAILAAHGGEIEVSSQPGQGTAFRFRIPLVERDPAGQNQNPPRGNETQRSVESASEGLGA